MKCLLIILLLCTPVFSQNNSSFETPTEKKNEIRNTLILNAGGFSNAIQYERNINYRISAGIFLKKNFSSFNIDDQYAIEDIGIGINSHFYLNKFRTPTFLNNYNTKHTFVKHFIELAIEYIGIKWYETQRNIDNNSYIISRELEKINKINLHMGIGSKYLFYDSYILQSSIGINRYLVTIDDLKYGAYINLSFGYLF